MAMNGKSKVEHTPSATADCTLEICSICGQCIDTDEWHPVVGSDDADVFRIHAFCGAACRDSWEE